MSKTRKRIAVSILTLVVIFGFGVAFATGRYSVAPAPMAAVSPNMFDLWTAINQERHAAGQSFLTLNPYLTEAAGNHCNDMVTQGYFAHVNPQGKQPFQWMDELNISYQSAGENITEGPDNTTALVQQDFYNSPEHRANTENPKFTDIGLSTCSSAKYPNVVVEMFIQAP